MLESLDSALERRRAELVGWHAEGTDCYRLLHGAVEGAPGTTIDRYGPVLLVQTWRDPLPDGLLPRLVERCEEAVSASLAGVWNHRARPVDFERWFEVADPGTPVGSELGLRYDVRPRHRGQDPLLFLDLRVVRRRVRAEAEGCSVLNTFAYTCGVGLCAAAGGAAEVWNVDFATSALDVGRANAERNGLTSQRFLREDCIPTLRQLAGLRVGRWRHGTPEHEPRTFDLVVLDPPRWSKGKYGAVDLVRDYASLFKPAVLATAPGGVLVATNNVAKVEREAWVDSLHRCARKAGRPLDSVEIMQPDADFPSPDGNPPLKVAWCIVG